MMISNLIFDIDGTMLDTEFAVLSSLQDTISELKGENLELAELTFSLGIPGEVTLQQLGVEDVEKGNAIWNNNLLKYSHTIKLFEEVEAIIRELKLQGYKLGIITSKNKKEYKNDFVPFGLNDYFDTVICVEDSLRPKPYPDPMLKYLKLSGAMPEEAIYIGDTVYDSRCASEANIRFGLALWGCHSPDNIYADYYFNSPRDILDILSVKKQNK